MVEMVHFVPATLNGAAVSPYRTRRCIPAVITRMWNPDTVNLVVFVDGSNDLALDNVPNPLPLRWETSVLAGPPVASNGLVNAEWHTADNCTEDSERASA